MDDAAIVAFQLGRAPRGPWRVAARCVYGYPACIATAPVTDAGEPFPTLFYLTCPHLVGAVARLESDGLAEEFRARLATDESLATRLALADEAYREARLLEGGGVDPTAGTGIAGQHDPFGVKCLHAHTAASLAGMADPIGELALERLEAKCDDRRCKEAE